VITVAPHPLLDVAAFFAVWPAPLGEVDAGPEVARLFAEGGRGAPFAADDAVRAAVRDLLRASGYKPTGRGKPSSEYLARAATGGALGRINAAVDAGNAVSLGSGLPVSVLDADRARPPLAVAVGRAGERYRFNASGQEIDVAGLLCLRDAEGPCANAVKDAQRTKTDASTARTLQVVWGTRALPGRAAAVAAWYRALCGAIGARTDEVEAAGAPTEGGGGRRPL
jgi:DNA/RNA-binding domain of Phe-tRNA-synthetase-like protein